MHAQSNPETLAEAVDRLEDLLDFHEGAWSLESHPFGMNPGERYQAVAFLPQNLLGGTSSGMGATRTYGESHAEAITNLADLVADHLTGRAA